MLERRSGRVLRISVALILTGLLLAGTLMGISPVLA
jgi:hypothetical protein